MKKNDPFKLLSAFLAIAGICSLTAGCVRLNRSYPDVRTYSLDVSSQAHGDYSGTPVSLRMNAFSAAPQSADRYLAYRTGEAVYESDFYNQFVAAPAELIRDQAAAWLKGSPLVRFVLKPGETASPCYCVDGTLTDLYGDYRDPNAPKAVLRMKLTVSEAGQDSSEVVFQKVYSREMPMDRISPQSLAESWNKELCGILAEFENDLKELVSKR